MQERRLIGTRDLDRGPGGLRGPWWARGRFGGTRQFGRVGITIVAVASLSIGSGAVSSTASASTLPEATGGSPHRGGTLTVLELQSHENWTSLDPATDSTGLDYPLKNAVYGQLFEFATKTSGGTAVLTPDLATGYKYDNGNKTVVITLRSGVTFTDGTPFNAAAVVYNWKRDLATTTCSCTMKFTQTTPPVIKAVGTDKVSITFTYPYASFVDALQTAQFNYIGSPTAIKKMGERAFALKPVGAGPFMVTSDSPGSTLALKRNPHYWQKGLPYLNNLTFRLVGSDESALEALNAGQGDVYENLITPSLAPQFAKSGYVVTVQPTSTMMAAQFNTRLAPFNNIKAREAVSYATNAAILDKTLNANATPLTQSFVEKGNPFFTSSTIPGTRLDDLAKAKALVKQLGGLSFKVFTGPLTNVDTLQDGLISEWKQAGIDATPVEVDEATQTAMYEAKKWQAGVHYIGALDPAQSIGPNLMLSSTGIFSGVADPKLDKILNQASATPNVGTRKKLYYQASKYVAQQAYAIFLYPVYAAQVTKKGVQGPGLTTPIGGPGDWPSVLWEKVSTSGTESGS